MAFAACVLMPLLETKPSKTDQNEDGWKYIDFSDTLLREACDSIETRFSSKVITHFADGFKSSQRARELANYVAEGETDFVDSGFATG